MPKSPARFTQGEVTRLLKAARDAGFARVAIEVLPSGGFKATYSIDTSDDSQPSSLQAWKEMWARLDRNGADAVVIAGMAGKNSPTTSPDEWQASLRASELSRRERAALEALYQHRDRDVHHSEIKGAGNSTQQSLQARGYAKMDGDRYVSWRITEAGKEFYRQISALPRTSDRDDI